MSGMTREVLYFDEGGAQNTDATLHVAVRTLEERKVSNLVVASGGDTVLAAVQRLAEAGLSCSNTSVKGGRTDSTQRSDAGVNVVGVTLQSGTWAKYGEPKWEKLDEARRLGARVLTCTHALMGNVESAIHERFGGMPPVELIAHTLYAFSQGTKVAVEVSMSAVDAGLVPAGETLVAVAGTGGGADTALLIQGASTVDFFDLRIREILCKPL